MMGCLILKIQKEVVPPSKLRVINEIAYRTVIVYEQLQADQIDTSRLSYNFIKTLFTSTFNDRNQRMITIQTPMLPRSTNQTQV